MQKNRQFDFGMKFLLLLVSFFWITSTNAQVKSLSGKFLDGKIYNGEYFVIETDNEDGVRVQSLKVNLNIAGKKDRLQYTYLADDSPFVEISNMGFLSVVVRFHGMEGHITYNYVVPYHGKLVSIGTVEAALHLGKIVYLDARPNENMMQDEINKYVKQILRFNPRALSDPSNIYSTAVLLLLGQGTFLTSTDKHRLTALYRDNDISDDPALLHAIKKIIGFDPLSPQKNLTFDKKTIVSNKAYFSDFPTSLGKTKSYLVKGDEVHLITSSSPDNEYWLVSYVSPRGRKTENWLRCEDIDYCLSRESDDDNK